MRQRCLKAETDVKILMNALGECSEYLKAAEAGKKKRRIRYKMEGYRRVYIARVNRCSKPQLKYVFNSIKRMFSNVVIIKVEFSALNDKTTYRSQSNATLCKMTIQGQKDLVDEVWNRLDDCVMGNVGHVKKSSDKENAWLGFTDPGNGHVNFYFDGFRNVEVHRRLYIKKMKTLLSASKEERLIKRCVSARKKKTT